VKGIASVIIGGLVASAGATPSAAQATATSPPVAQTNVAQPTAPRVPQPSRYQIAQMERLLEGAVEHAATVWRDRMQTVLPTETLITENARVRGFRLDGYGAFFDVLVPSLLQTVPWSIYTLDRNNLGLESALREIKKVIDAAGDVNVQQAFKRIELQVAPVTAASTTPVTVNSRNTTGAPAVADANAERVAVANADHSDSILNDPQGAWRNEVRQALTDAMLDYSSNLSVGPDEWLTIAARRNDDRSRIAPADSDAQTMMIRARGSDLAAFRAGQISKKDAIDRMEIRMF
jgi:hypothetical protein